MQLRMGEEAFEGMLGTSPRMQDVFATVRKVANSDVPVLITGESGTGKESIALAVHRLGRRRGGPFVVINCGAIPETLLESELFGHEKGAFTGAHILRKGRIEAADKGTLFLDEIGELSLPLQVKILRYLQEQTIERIGGREQHRVDARVIAATNRDLKQAMIDGKFREDLYFRIGVVSVALPALKERSGPCSVSRLKMPPLCVRIKRRMSASGNRLFPFTVRFPIRYCGPSSTRITTRSFRSASLTWISGSSTAMSRNPLSR